MILNVPKDSVEESYDVFLSHSHEDSGVIEMLAKKLEDEKNLHVWLDKWVIIPGKHWQQEIQKGLNQAKTCAVFIGEKKTEGWFREEVETALIRQAQDETFRVIPVILPNANKLDIDQFVSLHDWIDFSHGLNDKKEFHRLVCGIKGVPPGRGPIEETTNKDILEEDSLKEARVILTKIRQLQRENLIDDLISSDYQKKTLDIFVLGIRNE